MNTLTLLAGVVLLLTVTSFANNPTTIPWPVGSTPAQMSYAKTLMNSYGDPCNDWGTFHAGIDIDENTEATNGTYVRCVINGYVRRITDAGDLGWQVVIAPTMESDNGWVYGHLCDPTVPNPENQGWTTIGQAINQGDLIQLMDPNLIGPVHVHFSWVDVWNVGISLANPLDYLVPEPEGSSYWQFSPEALIPEFKFLILPEKWAYEWPTWWQNESEVAEDSIPRDFISGDVDVFFGVTLQGEAMGQVTSTGLAPERVYWELIREQVPEPVTLSQNYVYNFDCPLDKDDETSEKVFFNRLMTNLLNTDAPMICLTNCGSEQGWEDLGIENIEENSWRTNRISGTYNQETSNPVLAMYPDGEYSIEVACYSHTNDPIPAPPDPDPAVAYSASIPCELHNFQPALREVSMLDLATDQVYYHAVWEPSASGTSAELNVTVDQPVAAGTLVQVILVFTETIDTSSLSASLGPHSLGSGTWSGSVVANDTWIGSVTMPTDGGRGFFTLSVSASDLDDNTLMDPEGEGSPGGNPDTHHVLSLGFGADWLWSASVHAPVLGSPKLADMDGDGDLDIVVQCSDGWIHVLDDDGTSMTGWPVSGGWSSGNPDVYASPAIANLSGVSPSPPEILAVHPYGCRGYYVSGSTISPWSAVFPSIFRWFALSSPVAGDLTDNGNNDFVIGRQHRVVYPDPYIDINLLARTNTGSALWDTNWGDENYEQSVSSTPSLCDADADGELEVLVISDDFIFGYDSSYGTVYCLDAATGDEEWSTYVGGTLILGAVAAANLDGDDAIEIVVGATTGSNYIKVLNGSNGALQYSLAISGGTYAGASIADVDGNGTLDIVVSSTGGMLYCWDGLTGNSLSGFPVDLGTWTRGGVSIGDIDLDGELELVMTGRDGKLYAVNHDGSMTAGFPITVSSNPLSGQAALGDIDGDGRLEIIFGEEGNSVVHCYQLADNSAFTYLPWPQFQRDARNTGAIELDTTIPEPPTDFDGTGSLSGDVLTVDLSWTLSVNDPYNPDAVPPADVVSYRIYRKIPPRLNLDLVGTVSAGTNSYTDVVHFTSIPYPDVAAYFARAWDGTNESEATDVLKIILCSNGNIARNSRIREVVTAAIVESGSSATLNGAGSRLEPILGNCRVLTDGNHDTVYMPSSSARCVEIDLGAMFDVTDVAIIRSDLSLMESMRLELSTDGTNFRAVDSGRARYVRVYGAGGASEIEVMGTSVEGASIPIQIVREEQGFFRIASAEEGTPMTVSVFDLAGRRVWDGNSSSGEVLWNRRTSSGTPVPTGVYLLLIETDGLDPVTSRVVVR